MVPGATPGGRRHEQAAGGTQAGGEPPRFLPDGVIRMLESRLAINSEEGFEATVTFMNTVQKTLTDFSHREIFVLDRIVELFD